MGYDDDDDWVGTPPEGRISRDRADPDYWKRPFPIVQVVYGGLFVLVVIAIVLAVT